MSIKHVLKPFVERIEPLASAYRAIRDSRAAQVSQGVTPWGFRFAGNEAMVQGRFEEADVEPFLRMVAGCDVFVNVGANIGYYVCLALSRGVKVVAFEPMPSNVRQLNRNVQMNSWDHRVEVFPMALGDHIGIAEIYGAGTAASLVKGWAGISPKSSQLIPLNTLDNVLGDRVKGRSLVLIDIEGAELACLRGAATLLDASERPIWIVEIAVDQHQPQGGVNPHLMETFQQFWMRGYRSFLMSAPHLEITVEHVSASISQCRNVLGFQNVLFVDASRAQTDNANALHFDAMFGPRE